MHVSQYIDIARGVLNLLLFGCDEVKNIYYSSKLGFTNPLYIGLVNPYGHADDCNQVCIYKRLKCYAYMYMYVFARMKRCENQANVHECFQCIKEIRKHKTILIHVHS